MWFAKNSTARKKASDVLMVLGQLVMLVGGIFAVAGILRFLMEFDEIFSYGVLFILLGYVFYRLSWDINQ